MMNKLTRIKHTWLWQSKGVVYKATLYNNTFEVIMVRSGNVVIIMRNMTVSSQAKLVENMHKIKIEKMEFGL